MPLSQQEGGHVPPVISPLHNSEGQSAPRSHGPDHIERVLLDLDEATNIFIPQWGLRDEVRINSYRSCRDMIDNVATPAERGALEQVNNIDLIRRAYEDFGKSVIVQGELLRRFKDLSNGYWQLNESHKGCQGLAEKLFAAESENGRLAGELEKLDSDLKANASRERDLEEEVERVTRDRNEWLETSGAQAEKIRKLESELAVKDQSLVALQAEKGKLVAEVAQSDVVKQNAVRTLLPSAVRRLFGSVEYKKNMAKVYSLTYQAGFVTGAKVNRTEEETKAASQNIRKVNRDAPNLWRAEYDKLFEAEYPFIQKLADSYRLPLGGSTKHGAGGSC